MSEGSRWDGSAGDQDRGLGEVAVSCSLTDGDAYGGRDIEGDSKKREIGMKQARVKTKR